MLKQFDLHVWLPPLLFTVQSLVRYKTSHPRIHFLVWGCESAKYTMWLLCEQWLFVSLFMVCSTSDVSFYVSVVLGINAGTTATVALLRDGIELVVASVGDSRAMLCRKGKAVKLTVDHTPERKDEKERYISVVICATFFSRVVVAFNRS